MTLPIIILLFAMAAGAIFCAAMAVAEIIREISK